MVKSYWLMDQHGNVAKENVQAHSHVEALTNTFSVAGQDLIKCGPFRYDYVSETLDREAAVVERFYWKRRSNKGGK